MTAQDADLPVTCVDFHAAPVADVRQGLLGWVTFRLGGAWIVDGVAVRRTLDGRHVLSFPCRRDRAGREHHYLRPRSDAAREAIERRILGALGLPTEAPQ